MGALTPGVPGWVDLGSPDPEASKHFYSELFGWDPQPANPEFGGYAMFHKDGRPVAGVAPLMSEDQPVAWSTYVIVADADDTTARVLAAGGQVLVEPMQVGDQGRMAVYLDPTGAAIGVWQAQAMRGAEVLEEPGSLSWTELATRDPAAAKAFYRAVFDWEPDDTPFGGTTYTQWRLGARAVGGMIPMGAMFPPEARPHWGVYFAVEHCDDAVATVTKLGGTVVTAPMDIPQGRFAGVMDQHGAPFSVIQLA